MRQEFNKTSTLSTINFGKNHFGKSNKNKIFSGISDYNGVCLEHFQRMEHK